MLTRAGAWLVLSLLAAASLMACTPIVVGRQGTLGFHLAARDADLTPAPNSMGPLIASGSRFVLVVGSSSPQDDEHPPIVSSANVGPRGVARITAVDGKSVSLEAVEAGWVEVEVHTSRGRDSVRLEVSDVESASIAYWTSKSGLQSTAPKSGQTWVMVKGGTGKFVIHTRDAQGRPQLGYGATPPISTDADSGVIFEQVGPRPMGAMQEASITFQRAGLIALEPLGGAPLLVEVVEIDEIEGPAVVIGEPFKVGERSFAKAVGCTKLHSKEPVWLAGDVIWFSASTPDVCDVSATHQTFGDGTVLLDGKTAGICEIVAHLGTKTVSARVAIEPPPAKKP